jgi:hypothetical protein
MTLRLPFVLFVLFLLSCVRPAHAQVRTDAPGDAPAAAPHRPRIALVLSGGGARGSGSTMYLFLGPIW